MALPQPPIPQTATCYRHPGREAGRRCTRCGRPACSECLVQANVGSHCLECAKSDRPPVQVRARYWSARQPTLVTYTIIAINVAVFVWLVVQDPAAFTGGHTTQGQYDLAIAKPFLSINGEWYRLITAGFLHFSIIHIAFNMLLLFQLGNLLEPAIGRVRFGLLYFAALLAGSAGALLLIAATSLTGGASGAVFGLMAAAFVGLRNRGVNPFSTGIGTVLVLNLVLTFAIPGISIGGHIGGIIGGALAGWVIMAPHHRALPSWASYAAPVAVMVRLGVGLGHRGQQLTEHVHRGAPVGAAEQDGVHQQRHQLVPRHPLRPARRQRVRPRRRRRTRRRRSRRTAASSPGRPRGGPSTAAGSISQLAPSRSTIRLPAHRSPCSSAGGSGGPHSSPALVPSRSTIASAPASSRPSATARADERAHPPLDVELGPVRRRREVDGL